MVRSIRLLGHLPKEWRNSATAFKTRLEEVCGTLKSQPALIER